MNRKNWKIIVLVFLGFLLLVLPLYGISVFQRSPIWWVYNTILFGFGTMLLPVAIDLRSYRWGILGCFIIFVALILYFVVGPYLASTGSQGL